MLAPAAFDDAASRYLDTTALPNRLRWDPDARSWAVHAADVWKHVPAEYAVTMVCRFLADEFAAQQQAREPIPHVLTKVHKADTWTLLRAKVTRPAANAITRLASGSPAFFGLPTNAATTTARAATPASTSPRDEVVAAWVHSSVVTAPGSFLLRSSVTAAFKSAHANRPNVPSRQVVSRAAQAVLGPPRKRDGQYGWPDRALST